MHPRLAQIPAKDFEAPKPKRVRRPLDPDKPLTPRQRAIIRGYFAAGCRTLRAAQALGLTHGRVREVKAKPGARAYLEELEHAAVQAMAQARAAMILAPMLTPPSKR